MRVMLRGVQSVFLLCRKGFSTGTTSLLERELYQDNKVVRLVLNDVKRRNALSLEMITELEKELKEIDGLKQMRAVIIAANGPAFSSGHDLKQLRSDSGSEQHQKIFERCTALLTFIQKMQLPVIAEVKSPAAAAGTQLVATCDIVVASDKATFSVPGQRVGLFCSTPGVALVRAVPAKVALDMLLTGEPIDAHAALRAGLVSRVVPEDQVKFEALKVAEKICQYSRSVTALGKTFFYAQKQLGIAEAYKYGGKVMVENLRYKDAQEGITGFIEKRHPEFTHGTDKAH